MKRVLTLAAIFAVGLTGTTSATVVTAKHLTTARSITVYQKEHHLHVDGVLGHQTAQMALHHRRARRGPLTAADRRGLGLPPIVTAAPTPLPAPAVAASTNITTPVASSGGGGGLPACASESGTNYSTDASNTNPSGATGRYQIIPSTHAALCKDLDWSPAGQDECASRIYAAQGSGAWVGCGG